MLMMLICRAEAHIL